MPYSGNETTYLVHVREIGRIFSWLLLFDMACPVQPPAFFLSRLLLLGFGKLLSIKKEVALPLCCDVRWFYHELSKYVTIKVASARHSPVAFFLHTKTHTGALADISLILFTMTLTSRQARSYGRTQSGVIQRLPQTQAKKMTSKFLLSSNLHSLLSPDLNVKFNVLSLFFRRM